jgi:hypothetical protein
MQSQDAVKPSEINVARGFMGTDFRSSEKEVVARNLVVLSQARGKWVEFTIEVYRSMCSHPVSSSEVAVLDSLVAAGQLDKNGDRYAINDEFRRIVAKFRKA